MWGSFAFLERAIEDPITICCSNGVEYTLEAKFVTPRDQSQAFETGHSGLEVDERQTKHGIGLTIMQSNI